MNLISRLLLTLLLSLCCKSLLAQAPPPLPFNNAGTNFPQTGTLPQQQPAARIASNPTAPASDPVSLSAESVSDEKDVAAIQIGSIIGIIREGGILMFPILLCSTVLLVFVFERWLFLRKGRIIPKPFVRGVIEQLEQQQLQREEALQLCEENESLVSELFSVALRKWGRPAVEIEQAVVDAGEHITSELRKYLRLFNAISNLTPLLGLLGTVLGMIEAFNAIGQADAIGRPEMLASGIGAALVTTAAGLCVAIPAYTAYAYFLARTDKLILEMDALTQNVIEQICAENISSGTKSRSRTRKAA